MVDKVLAYQLCGYDELELLEGLPETEVDLGAMPLDLRLLLAWTADYDEEIGVA